MALVRLRSGLTLSEGARDSRLDKETYPIDRKFAHKGTLKETGLQLQTPMRSNLRLPEGNMITQSAAALPYQRVS